MKFYNNEIPYDNKETIEKEEFTLIKEPHFLIQFFMLLLLTFSLLLLSNFIFKPIFGYPARKGYSLLEYKISYFVFAILITVILRPLLKSFLLPEGPFSENMAFYYKMPVPVIQVNYLGAISKFRILFVALAQFLIFAIVCLLAMKLKKGFFYTFELVLFINATISSYGFYNAILAIQEPDGTKFIEYGMSLYSDSKK